jgi:circadian clock protein KaiB
MMGDPPPDGPRVRLRLYVAGDAPNSALAAANIKTLCEQHLGGAYDLEIVDLLDHPQRAAADRIVVTPTLLKLFPPPAHRAIGNLSDTKKVLLALGIA